MEHQDFNCERNFIEQIIRTTQKNMLVQLYCAPKFENFNLVDIYYRSLSENAIVMFLAICAIYPILFMWVAFIADKYLSVGMQDLAHRFRLSPTMAAVTLIAFANGAPDVISSLSAAGKEGGELMALGSLFGGFIFSSTLVVSNVVWNATGPVKLPKLAILKELGFYFLAVVVVIGFGFRTTSGMAFVYAYISLYVAYIAATLAIEKFAEPEPEEEELDDDSANGRACDDYENKNDLSVNKSKAYETEIHIEEKDENNYKTRAEKNFFELVVDEVVDEEGSVVENIVALPAAILGMFTVSYLENPFMHTPMKFLIISTAFAWILSSLELVDAEPYMLVCYGLGFGIMSLVFELAGLSKNFVEIVYELLSVFAAIGWIKIISGLIIDFITFLAFYFNIDQVILSAILLSAGNTIGDFFGNGALARGGAAVMGGIASYSGQIFNNFVGFSFNIIGNLPNESFDLFNIKKSHEDGETHLPAQNIYIIILISTVVMLIVLNVIYLFSSNFTLRKGYTYVLVAAYACFFTFSLVFGFLCSKAPELPM